MASYPTSPSPTSSLLEPAPGTFSFFVKISSPTTPTHNVPTFDFSNVVSPATPVVQSVQQPTVSRASGLGFNPTKNLYNSSKSYSKRDRAPSKSSSFSYLPTATLDPASEDEDESVSAPPPSLPSDPPSPPSAVPAPSSASPAASTPSPAQLKNASPPPNPLSDCSACGVAATSTCQRCRAAQYCGRECQSKHWPEHKSACNKRSVVAKGSSEPSRRSPTPGATKGVGEGCEGVAAASSSPSSPAAFASPFGGTASGSPFSFTFAGHAAFPPAPASSLDERMAPPPPSSGATAGSTSPSPFSALKPLKALPDCAVCGVPASNTCKRCRTAHYCSRECQVAHWPKHKSPCKSSPFSLREQELSLLKSTLASQEEALGPHHSESLKSMFALGKALQASGQLAEALACQRRCVAGAEMALGAEDANTLSAKCNLAVTLIESGERGEAERIFRKVLPLLEKAIDDPLSEASEKYGYSFVLNMRGIVQFNLGMLVTPGGESKALLEGAIETFEELGFSDDHPSVIKCKLEIGVDPFEKMRIFESSIAQTQSGRATLEEILQWKRLSRDLVDTGNHVEAEQLLRRTLEALERELGRDHKLTLETVNDYAFLLSMMKKHAEAEQFMNWAIQGCEATLGEMHEATLDALANLAMLKLEDLKQYKEAAEIAKRIVAGYEKKFGKKKNPPHPKVAFARGVLNACNEAIATNQYTFRM